MNNQSTSVARGGLFLSAALLAGGFVAFFVATAFHPSGIDPNNHALVFVQYAHWAGWTADHAGYFVAFTLLIAGPLVLLDALNVGRTVTRIGMILGGAAISMSALRMLVDGVVLKRAVDAWVNAPAAEQASRFAAAEVARWMEEASASYQNFLIGFTLLVVAGLILWTGRVPRPIGILLALDGIASVVAGWFLGESGFDVALAGPTYVTQLVPIVCAVYLAVVAWRMPGRSIQQSRGALATSSAG